MLNVVDGFGMPIKKLIKMADTGLPLVLCFDEKPKHRTFARYSVLFLNWRVKKGRDSWLWLGMSELPFHPQGFGQHGETDRLWHTIKGWRKCLQPIRFTDLPPDCQALVKQDLEEAQKHVKELSDDT